MEFFSPSEFSCKCGKCGLGFDNMNSGTLQKLYTARRDPAVLAAGIKFIINSAVRCLGHNGGIGGAKNSAHLTGHAIDIAAHDGKTKLIILRALLDAGFHRIGIADTFIHADDAPYNPHPALWTYK